MKQLSVLAFLPLILISSISTANQGQELHQANCVECHSRMTGGEGTVIYKRNDRLAKNLTALRVRVSHCANGTKAGWNQSQINAVTDYLNGQFYHY